MIFRFQEGDSLYHRLDPVSKFVWLACFSLLCLRFENAFAQSLLLIAAALIGRFAAKLTFNSMWRGLRLPMWFGLPYFVLQLLFVPGEIPFFKLGSLLITVEALDFSAAVSLRLVTLVLASLIFIVTTDPRDVVLALAHKLRVPYRFAFAVSVALRFLPILEAEAKILREAQRLRGLAGPEGVRNRIAWYRRFVYSVFVITVQRVQTIAEAMENKAFGKQRERTYRRLLAIPLQGKALMAMSGVLTAYLLIWF